MKVLFVFYNCGSGLSTHNGIALLSAIAKQKGHETKLLHFHEKLTDNYPDVYQPKVKEYNPDVIAFTATDFEYKKINEIAKDLKQICPNAFLLLGGKSAVEIATKDVTNSPFNAFCIGEAEIPWRRLLENSCIYDEVKGMWFLHKGELIQNPLGENVTDLDSLPFPDYSIFDMEKIIASKDGWLNIQFSRGCLYNCTYCYVTADKYQMFDKSRGEGRYGMDKYLRNNSVEYAMKYMEHLLTQYPYIRVFNLDDELPESIEMQKGRKYAWWLEFCKQYKERIYNVYGVEFVANGRINIMTEEVIKAMVDAHCRECRMGFESGSFRIRKDILDKPITNENMKEVYGLCDKYGLRTTSFTMIGNPTETEADVWETIKMTAELKPYLIRLTFCYPFENTRLWFYVKKHDLVKTEKLYHQHGYFEESVIRLPINGERLLAYRHLFPWFVNTLLLPLDLAEKYVEAMQQFSSVDYRNPLILDKINEVDRGLSESCGDLEHYCFFEPNTAYFHCKNKRVGEQIAQQEVPERIPT